MITLEVPTKTAASPLSLAPESELQEGENIVAFSELLKGFELSEDSLDKVALLQREQKEQKLSKESLLSLLQGSDEELVSLDIKEIAPALSNKIAPEDLKQLIADAKRYLKDKITASEGFKRAEVQKLPKTLSGLLKAAEKFGIDVTAITLEDVVVKKESSDSDAFLDDTLLQKSKTKRVQKESIKEQHTKQQERVQTAQESEVIELELKRTERLQKETPLFVRKESLKEISTQQIVDVKLAKNTSQKRTENKKESESTLKALLGAKGSLDTDTMFQSEAIQKSGLKSTVKVSNSESALEALLLGRENGDDSLEAKEKSQATMQTLKADSFEVKLNEAKQMIKYLSNDVKQAIENYKAPFTRVKVQLNPQQLGEVELTVVQRGKNLHVNLSSNNVAINTLAMNAQELRTQLQNSGINNASLNFSNNAEQGSSQQQQQKREHAEHEYSYFADENNEDVLSSLEIVIPSYA